MKKHAIALTVLAALLLGGLALAYSQGGFTGSGSARQGGARATGQVVKVADVKNLPDDAKVSLQGNILRSLGDEKYVFSDGSGEITVEIDDDKWKGLSVGENDRVEIFGEVDLERNGIEIDVERIGRMRQ